MPSFRNAADRQAILARIDRLTPDAAPVWGKFTVSRMLAHMTDSCRMALGELPVARKKIPLIDRFPMKQLAIYVLPFPKNSPTAPEIIARTPEPFEIERAQLKALVARLEKGADRPVEHPIFGALSADDWGTLGYRHLDHHLRQFGV